MNTDDVGVYDSPLHKGQRPLPETTTDQNAELYRSVPMDTSTTHSGT